MGDGGCHPFRGLDVPEFARDGLVAFGALPGI